MRVSLKELLEKLAVRHILTPYESAPWVYYDEDKGITCSAEVRMGPDGDEIECEVQFLHDEENDENLIGPQQKMYLRATPCKHGADIWSPVTFTVKGKSYVNEIAEWEDKACAFFQGCIQALNMNTLPDIEDLIEKHLDDDGFGGRSGRGKIGRKSPKIKPNQLLGMKGGM